MKALIQRVTHGSVSIDNQETAAISAGIVVLLGIMRDDTAEAAAYLAKRTAELRIFDDAVGVPNISVKDNGGEVLVVSQFTLCADTHKGNRPSYINAAPPEIAEPLYVKFVDELRSMIGVDNVKTGVFRAMMEVTIVNDGPFTMLVESRSTPRRAPYDGVLNDE